MGGRLRGPASLLVDFLFDRENRREEMRDLVIRFTDYGDVDKYPVPSPLNVSFSCFGKGCRCWRR